MQAPVDMKALHAMIGEKTQEIVVLAGTRRVGSLSDGQ